MRKIGFSIAAVVVVLGSFTIAANAQYRVLGRANIPFSFEAHGQRFDSGTYELRQLGPHVVRLQDAATGIKGVTLLCTQTVVESEFKIVFDRYGARYFFASLVAPPYQISLPKSDSESELAALGAGMGTVALLVKR
jgi:hypothetical protein